MAKQKGTTTGFDEKYIDTLQAENGSNSLTGPNLKCK